MQNIKSYLMENTRKVEKFLYIDNVLGTIKIEKSRSYLQKE